MGGGRAGVGVLLLGLLIAGGTSCCACDRALARFGGPERLAAPEGPVAVFQEAVRLGEYRGAWCTLSPASREQVPYTAFRYVALNARPPGWEKTVQDFVREARLGRAAVTSDPGRALVRVSDEQFLFEVAVVREDGRWWIDWEETERVNRPE